MLAKKVLAEKSEKRQRMTGQERRDFILARAKQVFARHSYREASTSQLAQESEVSEPMLYKHFGSKKALFLEVLNLFGSRFTHSWQEQVNQNAKGKPLRALGEIGLEYRNAIKADPDILKVFFQAVAESSDPEIASIARQDVHNLRDFIYNLLKKAQQEGQLEPDLNLEAATWGYMSMAFAMQLSLMLKMDDELDENLLSQINRLWLRALRPKNS
jgi:AcrR family transcriptional regulator